MPGRRPWPGPGGNESVLVYAPPVGLSLMEARLEVLRGEVDVVVGTEDPPSDYFAFGRGPGPQKILVGRDRREPVGERFSVPGSCNWLPPSRSMSARKVTTPIGGCRSGDRSGYEGRVLPEAGGQAPACLPGICVPEEIPIEVPEDALSMEVVLESGDGGYADLLVGLGSGRESRFP